jgi:hypothetical protein
MSQANTNNDTNLNTPEDDKIWDELLGSQEGKDLLAELAEKALQEAGLVQKEQSE